MADCRRGVKECITANVDSTVPSHFVVAVSGGVDSLALAWASEFVLPRLGHTVEAVIIDHQLQDDSADVAARTLATLDSIGLAASVVAVEVDDSGNLEDNARRARYDAMRALATEKGATAVLLGHTLDDQAETVLLGLTRGSGPGSIRGMSARRDIWLRPFLGITRETTRQVCVDVGLSWWDDPHNTDRRFVRPRIRHDILPLMETLLGPGVAQALAHTASLVAADDDYLNAVADAALGSLETDDGRLPVEPLAALAEPIRRRVMRRWVTNRTGVSMNARHTEQLDALVVAWRGQGAVAVGGSKLVRHDGHLRIEVSPDKPGN